MPTHHLLMLLACSTAMWSIIGYAVWIKVRTVRLRASVLEIYARLHRRAKKEGCLNDQAFRHAKETLDAAMLLAESFSVATVFYLLWASVKKRELLQGMRTVWPKSENRRLQAAVDLACTELVVVVVRYLARETVCGFLVWMMFKVLPRKVAGEEVKSGVATSFEPLPDLSRSLVRC